MTGRIRPVGIRFAPQLRVANPQISVSIVGSVYLAAIVRLGRIGVVANRVLLGLVAVGVVSVFLRLATSVPSRSKRAAVTVGLAAGFFLLAFVARGLAELLGVALTLILALLGADQLVMWSRVRRRRGSSNPEGGAKVGSAASGAGTAVGALSVEVEYELGLRLEESGDLSGAEAAFRRAGICGHPAGVYRYGRLLEKRGEQIAARVAYQRSSRLGYADGAARLARLLEDDEQERAAAAANEEPDASSPAGLDGSAAAAKQRTAVSRRPPTAPEVAAVGSHSGGGRLSPDGVDRPAIRLIVAAADALEVIGPALERYLARVYGPDWLLKVNENRSAQSDEKVRRGQTPIPPLQPDDLVTDARRAISVIAYEPALRGPYAGARGMARSLSALLNSAHHGQMHARQLPKQLRILEELRHIAEGLSSQRD